LDNLKVFALQVNGCEFIDSGAGGMEFVLFYCQEGCRLGLPLSFLKSEPAGLAAAAA
jgi:hypothetical protein